MIREEERPDSASRPGRAILVGNDAEFIESLLRKPRRGLESVFSKQTLGPEQEIVTSRALSEVLLRDPTDSVPAQQGRPEPHQPMDDLAEPLPGLAPWLSIESILETEVRVRLLAERRGGVHHEDHREAFE